MRFAVALSLTLLGCGDNATECGFVDVMSAYRNIWPWQLAVNDTHVFYADFDIDGAGTRQLLRQPRGGGDERVLVSRPPPLALLGTGLALQDAFAYWVGPSEVTGNALYATPIAGGTTSVRAAMSECPPVGVAATQGRVYAGSLACNGKPSLVITADNAGGTVRTIWMAGERDGDVTALAAHEAGVYIATTAGLFDVNDDGTVAVLLGGTVHHVENHGAVIYVSTDEGVFAMPAHGTSREQLYAFSSIDGVGPFAVADGVFIADPPRIVHVSLETTAVTELASTLGDTTAMIVARGSDAYWSVLSLPNTIGGAGSFAGGIIHVATPCQ